ncbi:MAG: hypothetical protein U0T33_01160 [Bacteroidales bacterium]
MNTNDVLTKTGNVIRKICLKLELLFLAVLIASLILELIGIRNSGMIAIICYVSVALIYFLSAFSDNYENDPEAIDRFFIKLFELSSSVTCLGILFRLHNWPNNISFLPIGIISLYSQCQPEILVAKQGYSRHNR